jgi:hypothetical protein
LKRHQQSAHPSETAEEDKPFRCEFILAIEKPASGTSEFNLGQTSRRDEDNNQVCGKSFWTKDKLNVHVKGHEDQIKKEKEKSKAPKSWIVSSPSLFFSRVLPIDLVTSLQCPYCSETYHKHTQLRTHVVRVHPERLSESTTESGGKVFKPFKCEVEGCDWAFDTLQRLKVHGKVHQGESSLVNEKKLARGLWVCPYGRLQTSVISVRTLIMRLVRGSTQTSLDGVIFKLISKRLIPLLVLMRYAM